MQKQEDGTWGGGGSSKTLLFTVDRSGRMPSTCFAWTCDVHNVRGEVTQLSLAPHQVPIQLSYVTKMQGEKTQKFYSQVNILFLQNSKSQNAIQNRRYITEKEKKKILRRRIIVNR